MNENSIGSVIPVKNEVKAIDSSAPAIFGRLPGLAARYIANATAGNPNIIIGKQPAMKLPAVGAPAKNLGKSPRTISPVTGLVYSPKAKFIRLPKM